MYYLITTYKKGLYGYQNCKIIILIYIRDNIIKLKIILIFELMVFFFR